MYDENSMKSHIFWIKFKRVFLLIFFTIIGTSLGVVISDYIVNILLFPSTLRIIIVVASAVLFLALALLLTANTGKEIEDSYWKIAVYKKLVVISKKLDNLEPNESSKHSSKIPPKDSNENSNKNKNIEQTTTAIENSEVVKSGTDNVLEELKTLNESLNEKENLEIT